MKIELHPAEHALFLTLSQQANLAQQKAIEAMSQAQQYVAMLCEKAEVAMPTGGNLQSVKEDGRLYLQWPDAAPAPPLQIVPKASS